MTDKDDAPKSAVELAMARMRQKDADAGVSEHALTEAQKAEIAEIRRVYSAKLAQEEILFKSKMLSLYDPEQRQKLDENYRRDVQRLSSERDGKVEKVHQRA